MNKRYTVKVPVWETMGVIPKLVGEKEYFFGPQDVIYEIISDSEKPKVGEIIAKQVKNWNTIVTICRRAVLQETESYGQKFVVDFETSYGNHKPGYVLWDIDTLEGIFSENRRLNTLFELNKRAEYLNENNYTSLFSK